MPPIVIKNPAGEVKPMSAPIMAYFGKKEGQTLADFMGEVRQLTPEAKEELAIGAAKELGWSVETQP